MEENTVISYYLDRVAAKGLNSIEWISLSTYSAWLFIFLFNRMKKAWRDKFQCFQPLSIPKTCIPLLEIWKLEAREACLLLSSSYKSWFALKQSLALKNYTPHFRFIVQCRLATCIIHVESFTELLVTSPTVLISVEPTLERQPSFTQPVISAVRNI